MIGNRNVFRNQKKDVRELREKLTEDLVGASRHKFVHIGNSATSEIRLTGNFNFI